MMELLQVVVDGEPLLKEVGGQIGSLKQQNEKNVKKIGEQMPNMIQEQG